MTRSEGCLDRRTLEEVHRQLAAIDTSGEPNTVAARTSELVDAQPLPRRR